jgi:hypothetical protein
MENMRIDIIRKELDRRYAEIDEFSGGSDVIDEFSKVFCPFFHFLVLDPDIRTFIVELTRFDEDYYRSKTYDTIRVNAEKSIEGIVTGISGYIDKFKSYSTPYWNKFLNIDNSDIVNDNISAEVFYNALKEKKYQLRTLADWDIVEQFLETIFYNALKGETNLNNSQLTSHLNEYAKCRGIVKAYLYHQSSYVGAKAAVELAALYICSPLNRLSQFDKEKLGSEVYNKAKSREIFQGTQSNYIDERKYCGDLYHAVDQFLISGKSKHHLINRLITYCTWIKRDDFAKIRINKESGISKILEEFIFNNGYFPIVNFKTGNSIPDILIDPTGANVRWDNSILIELKQSIGKQKYTPKRFETDIGQAQDYLIRVKGLKPELADSVYLLIFYDGNIRLPDKSLLSVTIPDSVKVKFIYVGDKSPSKLTN